MLFQLIKRYFIIYALLSSLLTAEAQPLIYFPDESIPVHQSGYALNSSWAGGFNSPQYSSMDLNMDGVDDLVVFERTNNRVTTFVAFLYQGWKRIYVHSPKYEPMFPALSSWVLLVDYNLDGKKDIFTYSYLGVTVYKNISVSPDTIKWKIAARPLLTKFGTNTSQIYTNITDIPAIVDVDSDGDYDIMDYNFFNGSNLEFHKNLSQETFGNSDSLMFRDVDQCWGGISENFCDYTFGSNCPVYRIASTTQIQHVGASILSLFDADGDGAKEVFSGKENCVSLFELPNKGNSSSPLFNSYNVFPSSTPIAFEGIPGIYREDLDFDGKKDMVATPSVFTNYSNGVFNNVDFQNSSRFYKNTGTNVLPVFNYVQNNFLQDNMIELGENAAPAFADFDADGDLDMFIGNRGLIYGASFYATISLYENIGTSMLPEFNLLTADYLSLSSKGYAFIRPVFTDLNGDNATDLAFACYNTSNTSGGYSTKYILNSNLPAAPFAFNINNINIIAISMQEDNPFFYDVDSDGDKDLLIGRAQGNLAFYQNTGTPSSPVYTLITDTLGGIHIDSNHEKTWLSITVQDVDADGNPDLVTGDNSGILYAYPNFLSNLAGVFVKDTIFRDSSLSYYNMGKYLYLTSADLNNDNVTEIIMGNNTGGINILNKGTTRLGILSIFAPQSSNQISVSLSPNPANSEIRLASEVNCSVAIIDLLGNLIWQKSDLKRDTPETISVANLSEGFYIVKFTTSDNKSSIQKLIIQK
ncbi:MAG TPA: FG-GAP-like repeat-containing protein [Cytophagaceae bacterium]|jgi:hypothetical protein|nr:FG-GAP-like repeat-containing protein [Cytophagaceae bacterium]